MKAPFITSTNAGTIAAASCGEVERSARSRQFVTLTMLYVVTTDLPFNLGSAPRALTTICIVREPSDPNRTLRLPIRAPACDGFVSGVVCIPLGLRDALADPNSNPIPSRTLHRSVL